ncbi:MAG: PAS domain S-box protein, partial [Pseudomonadota bacterium]|nr:PAS domain S-box protein [Pseudomonadota bacterium]
MAQPSSDSPPFSTVGIGASAGGIEALQVFFEALPEQLGVAFVVVVHLDPEHRSDLAPILARWTRLPVEEVSGTVPLKADHVYVIPPNRRLQITDTEVGAFPFEQPQGQRAPIDLFFRSLAEQHGDGFAVILSGGGSDGAVGVKAVKEQGGLILVQDPKEAAFDGMPRAAIATGMADLVLPVRDLAHRLVELIRSRQRVNQVLEGARLLRGEDEATLGRVLAHLHTREEMPREARPYAESIVDTVREPLIVLTPQLRVKSANQAFYTFFQVKPEETEGRLIYELGNRQWDIPKLRQLLEGVLLQNEVFDDFVVTHDFEQLGLRTLLLNARRLDTVQLILLAIEDITERKRIEEALCRSEEFHRLAVEAGHVGTWDVDLETGDCCISSQMADLMGYARDQQALPPLQWQQVVPRTQWMASVHPQDRPAMEAAIAAAIKQEGLFELEFRIQLADGTSRWLYSKGDVTRDASGKRRLRGASINITARRQAEEALRQSEEHYRLLVESAREYAIFMLDLNSRIASWSSGAERLFGYTEAEAVGRSCADIFTV